MDDDDTLYALVETEGGEYHLIPLGDLFTHSTEDCACNPDFEDGMHIHFMQQDTSDMLRC